jgi:hypothetical protein
MGYRPRSATSSRQTETRRPYDFEAEQCLLACPLLDIESAEVAGGEHEPEVFHEPLQSRIFAKLLQVGAGDPMNLCHAVSRDGPHACWRQTQHPAMARCICVRDKGTEIRSKPSQSSETRGPSGMQRRSSVLNPGTVAALFGTVV